MFGLKLVLLLALLATALLCGALPLRRRGGEDAASRRLLEWGNAFAAGIFLGAGFVHMLPEATAAWEQLGWHYPIGTLLAAAAIVFMLLFEHVLPPEDAHHAMHAPSADRFGAHAHGGDARHADPPGAVYAILIALSIHSLLEGLALGAQRDLRSALVIFAAILAHKSMEGFALGVSLARRALPAARALWLLALFAMQRRSGSWPAQRSARSRVPCASPARRRSSRWPRARSPTWPRSTSCARSSTSRADASRNGSGWWRAWA